MNVVSLCQMLKERDVKAGEPVFRHRSGELSVQQSQTTAIDEQVASAVALSSHAVWETLDSWKAGQHLKVDNTSPGFRVNCQSGTGSGLEFCSLSSTKEGT